MAAEPRYEFVRERPTMQLLYGFYADVITRKIPLIARPWEQPHSYSFYQQIDLTDRAGPHFMVKRIPEGYFYHLDGLRVYWPPDSEGDPSPVLRFTLFHSERHRRLYETDEVTRVPMQIDKHTTPAATEIRRYMVRDNNTYLFSGRIMIEITGNATFDPAYVRILTEGIRIPRHIYWK